MAYQEKYGTSWGSLTRNEAIERGYALGVAAGLNEGLPDEYDRVLDEVDTMYERSLVELAFDEGQKAVCDHTDVDSPTVTWKDIVEDQEVVVGERGRSSEIPPVVTKIQLLERQGDSLGRIRLPDFLSR